MIWDSMVSMPQHCNDLITHTDVLSLAGTSSRSGITPYQVLNLRDVIETYIGFIKTIMIKNLQYVCINRS